MYFISKTKMSGIGQVVEKYSKLIKDSKIVDSSYSFPVGSDIFFFALPLDDDIQLLNTLLDKGHNVKCMTVCETETVHPKYEKLFEILKKYNKKILVPSEFCKKVFEKQFDISTIVLRHYVPHIWPPNKPIEYVQGRPYIFYHIGNVMDPRKNIQMIINAFIELKLENSKLFLKATCISEVKIDHPDICVVNGLLADNVIEKIHIGCHCYVSCSHSEGVGMGAVEAALYNKPVIISDYGGASEYIRTPFLVKCDKGEIGYDDFLFQRDMEWGHPRYEDLVKYMKMCYESKLTFADHSHTHDMVKLTPRDLFQG